LMNDLKFAFRQLLKNPGFTAVAVLTLALGIGANTAVFSVIHGVVLRPLPYPEPDRLVTLWESSPERGIEQERVSGPNYLDWRVQNTSFEELAVMPGWTGSESFNLVLGDVTMKIRGSYASASIFPTLGTRPLMGRTLLPEDDQKEGNRVVVLGHGLWQRHFGGDPDVLGQVLTVDSYGRRDYEIVGVMPPGFGLPGQAELWLPIGWMDVDLNERRSAHWHNVIARLKPGVTLDRARTEMNMIQARLRQAFPGETMGSEVSVVPLLNQALGRNLRASLLLLWGVVGGVLLIACANVANLMMARAAAREREMALRRALGAGSGQIVRQLLSESVVLSLIGGAAGVLLGWGALQIFLATNPAHIPRLEGVTLDRTSLLFTLGVSVLTGVLFGLAPAWQLSRPSLHNALKEGTHGTSPGVGSVRTRNLLVVAEVALSVVLLIGAGLLLQSFARMLNVDRGFQPRHLVVADLDFSVSGFTTWVEPRATRPQVPLLQLMERLRAQPGVEFVGACSKLPRRENRPPHEAIALYDRPAINPEDQLRAEFTGISPGWVTAMGGRVLQGRDLNESDSLHAPGTVLVNDTFVRRFFPGENPIGKRIRMGETHPPANATNRWGIAEWNTIVGVVADVKSLHPQPETVPEVYQSYWQWPMQNPSLLIRTRSDPAAVAGNVRRETRILLPNLPTPSIRTMEDVMSEIVARPRLQTGLLGLFAGLALLLATVGLYGVLAFGVHRRTREIGIRIAIGTQRGRVLAMIIQQGMKLTLTGAVIGVLLAVVCTRVMQGLLYGVSPLDPWTFILAVLLLGLSALAACWIPARRAAKVDPMVALRSE
jgi:putative ABC transport system permease protein